MPPLCIDMAQQQELESKRTNQQPGKTTTVFPWYLDLDWMVRDLHKPIISWLERAQREFAQWLLAMHVKFPNSKYPAFSSAQTNTPFPANQEAEEENGAESKTQFFKQVPTAAIDLINEATSLNALVPQLIKVDQRFITFEKCELMLQKRAANRSGHAHIHAD